MKAAILALAFLAVVSATPPLFYGGVGYAGYPGGFYGGFYPGGYYGGGYGIGHRYGGYFPGYFGGYAGYNPGHYGGYGIGLYDGYGGGYGLWGNGAYGGGYGYGGYYPGRKRILTCSKTSVVSELLLSPFAQDCVPGLFNMLKKCPMLPKMLRNNNSTRACLRHMNNLSY